MALLAGKAVGQMVPDRNWLKETPAEMPTLATHPGRIPDTYPEPPLPTLCDCGQMPAGVVQWRVGASPRSLWLCQDCLIAWKEDEADTDYVETTAANYWGERIANGTVRVR